MSGGTQSKIKKRVLVAGATGTMGRAVVQMLTADGHEVLALLRSCSKPMAELDGAKIWTVDLADTDSLEQVFGEYQVDTVVSCIASRSGTAEDAHAVDYLANLALLNASEEMGTEHFILLSAICVQRPKLAFQRAKLAFEKKLKASKIDHTIIHPTAFFKSLSGQVDRVLAGKPFLLFGDGKLTRCKPISDVDLGRFIADCVTDPGKRNATFPIGGPGPAITLKEQGELLFQAAGLEPKFRSVPVGMFDLAIGALSLVSWLSKGLAEKAEYARIGRYYATESMLVLDPETGQYSAENTPEFGSDTLLNHYRKLIAERRNPSG